jgi:T-complex protein 1 subunit theta
MFQQGGLQSLLKEGSRHYLGLEEAILKNIDACKQLSMITRTSLGPYGMNKIVVNTLEKLFVTSDAATIMKELDVSHPAAKLIVMAAKMQESEVGDGTNLVVVLAGELLRLAEELISTGLHPSEIVAGYEKASKKAEEYLNELAVLTVTDLRDKDQIVKILRPVISSKIYGYEDHLANCAAEACLIVTEGEQKFDIENLRVAKLTGGNILNSHTLRGLVIARKVESTVKKATSCKVAVYGCPLDPQHSDTKGTVLITNAEELMNYNKGEEQVAKKLVDDIVESGAKAVVCGGSISEMCMHFLELQGIFVVKVTSKFELRRVCKVIGATALVRLGAPTAEELGSVDEIRAEEISGHEVTIIRRETEASKVATVVLRASTNNMLDDAERALDDAFNTYRVTTKEPRFVAGAGGCEASLAKRLKEYATTQPGLDQYAILRYAQALEIIPKTLAENSGHNANELLAKLYAENSNTAGIDIEEGQIKDMSDSVVDHLGGKQWAIRLASDAALTVLRIDQIIMAKPAGGPKPPSRPPQDED